MLTLWQVGRLAAHTELDRNLISAVQRNDSQEVALLLHQGANANARISYAELYGFLTTLFYRLSGSRVSPNRYVTPMEMAASINYRKRNTVAADTRIIEALLDAGARPNDHESDDYTPLAHAAYIGDLSAVQTLVRHGADVKQRFMQGQTALHVAGSDKVAEFLVESGADVSAVNDDGFAPLIYSEAKGDIARVKLLVRLGVHLNVLDNEGYTPLIHAAHKGNVEMVKALIAGGARVDMHDKYGLTALHWAAHFGKPDVIKALASAGADPNAIYQDGFTPLIGAANDGNAAVVQALLEVGANPKLKTKEGYNAEAYARSYGIKANPEDGRRILLLLRQQQSGP